MTKIKFLCIDPGFEYTGIAISYYGKLSEGLATIHKADINQQLEKIMQIVDDYNPERVIIGLPKRGEVQKYSRQLGKVIEKNLGIPITYADEDKTSIRAKDAMAKSKKSSDKIHQVSAAVILQNFIDDLVQ